MPEDRIAKVEIDDEGRFCIHPETKEFTHIYRAAMEVGWDGAGRFLFSPRLREGSYPTWFRQIVAAAIDECGVQLKLTPATEWINVSADIRSEIALSLADRLPKGG